MPQLQTAYSSRSLTNASRKMFLPVGHFQRDGLAEMMVLFAVLREIEAAGSGDNRYAEAADAIKRIAGTPIPTRHRLP
jgi:hypothetical protein